MANGSSTAEIRSWARSQGIDVPDRGRLNATVVDAWTAAQGSESPAVAPVAEPVARTRARKATSATKRAKAARPRPTGSSARPQQVEEPAASHHRTEERLAEVEQQCEELQRRLQRLEEAQTGRRFRRRRKG